MSYELEGEAEYELEEEYEGEPEYELEEEYEGESEYELEEEYEGEPEYELEDYEDFPTPPPSTPRPGTGTIPVGPIRVLPACRVVYLDLSDLAVELSSLRRQQRRRPRNLRFIRAKQIFVRNIVNRILRRLRSGFYIQQGCTKRDLRWLDQRIIRLRGLGAPRSQTLITAIRRAMRRAPRP